MSELAVLLFLLILIALFSWGIFNMKKQPRLTNSGTHKLIIACSRGIYALCFSEGYVILTENITQAWTVCIDLKLNPHPYWSQIVHSYSSSAEALACLRELENHIGPSVSSFATLSPNKTQITFQGFISTVK